MMATIQDPIHNSNHKSKALCVGLLATALLPAAHAAEVTELAPRNRGDIEIRYDLAAESGELVQDGKSVGSRDLADHVITYTGNFSFYTGSAFFFEVPQHVSQTVKYADTQQMVYDPLNDAGTMINTPGAAEATDLDGHGLGGVWIGLRGTPISQEIWAARGDRSTWLIEGALRFRDKTNFWTTEGGERGAGEGAPAYRLRTAFSTSHGRAQPYLVGTLTRTGRINLDVVEEDGTTVARGLEVRPASTVDVLVGSELLAGTYGTDGAEVQVDFRTRFTYTGWQDIPSGTFLPSVLDASKGSAATETEHLSFTGGLGIHWRFVEYVQLNLSGEVGVRTPRQVEHFYPVTTNMGDIAWGIHTGLRFRARDPLFAQASAKSSGTNAPSPAPLDTLD